MPLLNENLYFFGISIIYDPIQQTNKSHKRAVSLPVTMFVIFDMNEKLISRHLLVTCLNLFKSFNNKPEIDHTKVHPFCVKLTLSLTFNTKI